MPRTRQIITFIVCLALLSLAFGCASTKTSESTGQYIDDSTITTKVKAAILKDPMLKSMQIGVETYKGDVQLSGFVDNEAMVDRAGVVARGVAGVREVHNNLVVR
ncbi:transport-associated protein [Desulfovibrio sp. X2]|uniref:BON domain-containing protein n=1 Tax=Desulfovibrio sp. X2 TaxID=941449 RepID=UPI000358ED86|nr:BON domain-containing protein [Desulfovibrio sp. X2]EPR37639.1 transport-associated protein [Desulfovibrio sp. X2]